MLSAGLSHLTPMNKENILKSLEIMWKGVLAIFITIAIITVVSILINVICNKARQAVEKKKEELKKLDDSNNKE